MFRDQYVTTEELCSYLQATDIFVSPYLNEAQVTSGALSYAMGAGAAVVSTPYWHAQELLADGRGCLFPFADSAALGERIISLLNAPAELAGSEPRPTSSRARSPGRGSARSTSASARRCSATGPNASAPRESRRAPAACPSCASITCVRMTDDTGIIQHATFSVPARDSGYCVDDNARALIVALHADRLSELARDEAARRRPTSASCTRRRRRTAGSATS